VHGKTLITDQEIYTEAKVGYDKNKDALRVADYAREYWRANKRIQIVEGIVNGEVRVIGLADYVKKGDRIEIITEDILDDEGHPIPKGSQGPKT